MPRFDMLCYNVRMQAENTSTFLTPDELRELTGYSAGMSQEKWLKGHGLNVARNRAGRVILARAAVIQWHLGGAFMAPAVGPDWSKIR